MSNLDTIRALSADTLFNLATKLNTTSSILTHLGISSKDLRARRLLNQSLTDAGIDITSFGRKTRYTNKQVIEAVRTSFCISDVLAQLNLTKHGDNFKTIRTLIEQLGIDTSHFSKDAAVRNAKRTKWTRDNIFVEHSKCGRGNLNRFVLEHSVLTPYRCSITECTTGTLWCNKPIKLTVDHINGINDDNHIENLRWLCPNCHSQTPTFGSKSRVSTK